MRSLILFYLLFCSLPVGLWAQDGTIRGVVFDGATGEYLVGVTLFAEGTTTGTISDLDGHFNLNIAPGSYKLQISYISYQTLNLSEIEVKAGEVTNLGEIRLEEATISLNEVTVTAKAVKNTETAVISMRKKSPNVLDGISAGTIKRLGDSDAAGVLKRLSGVSVSGDKYVYVRGLGDRYIKSMLNGVDIPGLDPDRNTLQMDIFPSSVINNIIVYKSFTANLPADFTGGLIDITLKDFPSEKEGSVHVGLGYNPNSHFRDDFLSYEGGKLDFLGFDDGTRAIPATENIPQFAEAVGNPNGEAGLRYQEILNSFSPNMTAFQQKSFADIDLGFSLGNQVPKENYSLGYNVSFSYKNTTDYYADAEYGKYGLSSPDIFEMDRREYQLGSFGVNSVLLSGLAGLALKTNRSKIGLTLLHLQNGETKAGIFDFVGSDQGSDFVAYQHGLDYSQRSLSHVLLDGNHFNSESKLRINWKLSTSYSLLADPDVRFTRYEVNPDGSFRIGTEVGFPERIWRDLNELNTSGVLNIVKDFNFLDQASKLHFGVLGTYKNRDYIIRNFAIVPRGDYPLTGNPDELFFEKNLWPKNGQVGLGTTYETPFIPTNPNQYNANSINLAGYVSAELAIWSSFKAIIGLRLENYMQYYTGTDQLRTNVFNNEKVLSDLGLFPSLNLLFQLSDQQNLRASFSRTIARPSFKELSFAEIYDPISGITFIGGFHKDGDEQEGVEYWSGNLVSTNIQNMDLRWETFGKDNQMFSLGGFYKLFNKPIEIVQYTKQVGAFQPRNVGNGQSFGVEFEFRQSMGFISERISGLRVNANITWSSSKIKMSDTEYQSRLENARLGQEIEEYRPMAGQAPYLINGGISYSGGKEGFWERIELGLFYNVQGTTLEYIGVADRPDIYTRPFHSLNFNSSFKLGEKRRWALGLKVKNLLQEDIELVYKSFEAEDQFFEKRSPGILSTLKLSYNFR